MVAPDPHRYTVDLHGSTDNVRVGDTKLSPKDLADIIRSSGDWDGKQPIRLISCQTGTRSDGFAAQLSRELGVDVVSPTKDAWVDDMGNVFASSTEFDHRRGDFAPGWPPNGDWVTFRPDGTNAKHDKATPPGTTPTWGDGAPENRPRAWRRGDHLPEFVRDSFGNWHEVAPPRNQRPPHPAPPVPGWGGQRPPMPPRRPMQAPQWGNQQRPVMPPSGPGPRGNAPVPPRPAAPWQPPAARGEGFAPGRQQPAQMPARQEPTFAPPPPPRQEPVQAPPPERRWEQSSAAPAHPAPARPDLRADVQWFRSDGTEVGTHRQDQEPAPPQDAGPEHHEETPDAVDETPGDSTDSGVELVDETPDGKQQETPASHWGDLADMRAKFLQQQGKWANHGEEQRAKALAEGAIDHRGLGEEARAFGAQAAFPGAERHFEDVSPNAVWRVDDEMLNRMDSRHPSEIDEAGGFEVRPDKQGGDTHGQIANNSGRMVSATRDDFYYEAVQYGQNPPQHGDVKWNYKINAPGGLDLLATLREDGNHALALQADWEAEIGFVGGIDKKYIPFAPEVKWDAGEQKWIPTGEIYYFGTKDGENGSDV